MADFELLSVYISIKTKGLENVFRDFARARRSAQQLSNIPIGGNVRNAANHARRFNNFIRSAQISMARVSRSTQGAVQQQTRLNEIQRRLESRLAQGNITQTQRLRLERLITQTVRQREAAVRRENAAVTAAGAAARAAARNAAYLRRVQINSAALEQRRQAQIRAEAGRTAAYLRRVQINSIELERRRRETERRLADRNERYLRRVQLRSIDLAKRQSAQANREIEQRRLRTQQALNSISLETGFIAPFLRLSTNLFRISNAFKDIARTSGASATGIAAAGRAGLAFGALLVGLQGIVGLLTSLVTMLARVAMRALTEGFRFIFGPTLAFLGLIRRLIQNLPILAGLLGGVLIRNLTNVARQFQQIRSTFDFAFGADARGELSRTIALANRMGVPLGEVAKQYAKITAAARDAGIAQADLRALIQGVSSASIALGLDTENINGIFFAFEQIISKGRLSAEELRRQLGDRLPGAFQIAARALGVTTQRLDELLEKGAIESKVFIQAIGSELNRTFGAQAQSQVGRITASVGRLNNQWLLLRGVLAERIEPALVGVIEGVTRLLRAFGQTAVFDRFGSFIVKQLRTLESNIELITQRISAYLLRIGPTLQRLARLIVVFNTVSLGVLITAFGRMADAVDRIIASLEKLATAFTGLRFDKLKGDLTSIIAIMESIPIIFDIINLKIRQVVESLREGHRIIMLITGPLRLLLDPLNFDPGLNDVVESGRKIQNMQREIDLLTKQLEDSMEAAFNRQRLEQFAISLKQLFIDMQNRLSKSTGLWLSFGTNITGFFTSIFANVAKLNGETKKAFDLAGEKKGSQDKGSIVDIAELRNTIEGSIKSKTDQETAKANVQTEKNTSSIASSVASLDKKISEMPELVSAAIRSAVLLLPGGGLSR